jgi:ferredoxin-NADP reductase
MNTSGTRRQSQELAARGRGPVLPRFAFSVIDGVLRTRTATVVNVIAETPTIFSLRVQRPPEFRHVAGQHLMLRLQTRQGPDMRPLSIASMPDSDELEFATRAGPSAFKRAFMELRPGDRVKVSRPLGTFSFDRTRPAVMVAGGIGITPLRSMLLTLATEAGDSQPVHLLFANRSPEEIPYRVELERLAQLYSGLRITWVLPETPTPSLGGEVLTGHIDRGVLSRVAAENPRAIYYVTGPARMVDDMTAVLRDIGLPKSHIRQSRQTFPLSH